MSVTVNGEKYSGTGHNKQVAKQAAAAESALRGTFVQFRNSSTATTGFGFTFTLPKLLRGCLLTNRHPRRSLGSVKVKPKPVVAVAVLLTVCPTLTQRKVMRTCRTKGRRKVVVWLVGSSKGVGSETQRRRRTR